MMAISLRQRSIHAGAPARSSAISSKDRPSPSSIACLPVYSWYRRTMQSAYFGSISINRALRPRRSHPINVLPDRVLIGEPFSDFQGREQACQFLVLEARQVKIEV